MILHCGEALIDFIPVIDADGQNAYLPVPGGSPYNTSIATARLGAHSAFLGRISRDFFGNILIANLRSNAVDQRFIIRSDDPSTLGFVKKSESGEAEYAFYAEGAADRNLMPSDLPEELGDQVHCLQIGSISLIPEPVGSTIEELVRREHGRRVVALDPNIREVLIDDVRKHRDRLLSLAHMATLVRLSEEDLLWMIPDVPMEDAAKELLVGETLLVAVTRGAEGSFALGPGWEAAAPAVPVEISDTVGAGDSFHAAVLVWLEEKDRLSRDALARMDAEEGHAMLAFAGGVAAITCGRRGADPPTRGEARIESHQQPLI